MERHYKMEFVQPLLQRAYVIFVTLLVLLALVHARMESSKLRDPAVPLLHHNAQAQRQLRLLVRARVKVVSVKFVEYHKIVTMSQTVMVTSFV